LAGDVKHCGHGRVVLILRRHLLPKATMPSPCREIEICVDSPAGLAAAVAARPDRIELCAALALDGLTPGPGLVRMAAGAGVPVMAMIRPRAGDFVFGAEDRTAALADIEHIRSTGLAGVVLGASLPDGRLDLTTLGAFIAESAGLDLTLHRAFDVTPDPFDALEEAVDLGFSRILTSGQARTAPEGAELLARLVEAARGRIAIMAGAGIRAAQAHALAATGVPALHGSFRGADGLPDGAEIARLRAALAG
jgi:copper homeostasis protein